MAGLQTQKGTGGGSSRRVLVWKGNGGAGMSEGTTYLSESERNGDAPPSTDGEREKDRGAKSLDLIMKNNSSSFIFISPH